MFSCRSRHQLAPLSRLYIWNALNLLVCRSQLDANLSRLQAERKCLTVWSLFAAHLLRSRASRLLEVVFYQCWWIICRSCGRSLPGTHLDFFKTHVVIFHNTQHWINYTWNTAGVFFFFWSNATDNEMCWNRISPRSNCTKVKISVSWLSAINCAENVSSNFTRHAESSPDFTSRRYLTISAGEFHLQIS